MKIGSFVCSIEDEKHTCVAIIVYDHSVVGYSGLNTIKWLEDGHLSTRDDDELKELTAEQFCRSWCKNQIEYH